MPRTETKAELKARADRASQEATLYMLAALDLANGRQPDALIETRTGKGKDRVLTVYRLYRAKGGAGGILVITCVVRESTHSDIHYFEEYKRAVDESTRALGGEEWHARSDALRYLWNERAAIFERLAGRQGAI